jgi:hypothetical protein
MSFPRRTPHLRCRISGKHNSIEPLGKRLASIGGRGRSISNFLLASMACQGESLNIASPNQDLLTGARDDALQLFSPSPPRPVGRQAKVHLATPLWYSRLAVEARGNTKATWHQPHGALADEGDPTPPIYSRRRCRSSSRSAPTRGAQAEQAATLTSHGLGGPRSTTPLLLSGIHPTDYTRRKLDLLYTLLALAPSLYHSPMANPPRIASVRPRFGGDGPSNVAGGEERRGKVAPKRFLNVSG